MLQASEPGTIRGDYCIEVGRNVIHGSDSVENAQKEIALWFGGECAAVKAQPGRWRPAAGWPELSAMSVGSYRTAQHRCRLARPAAFPDVDPSMLFLRPL